MDLVHLREQVGHRRAADDPIGQLEHVRVGNGAGAMPCIDVGMRFVDDKGLGSLLADPAQQIQARADAGTTAQHRPVIGDLARHEDHAPKPGQVDVGAGRQVIFRDPLAHDPPP